MKRNNSKKEIEIEYTLSNEDIKFPTFFDLELCKIFKTQKMSKEILIQDLNQIIKELKYIIDTLIDITHKDKNNFNTLCLYYKINSYDYIIIINLIKELTQVILNKIENNGHPLDLNLLDDYLNKDVVDTEFFLAQHKINDKQFRNISKFSSEYINEIKEIYSSENECGILFMCHTMKYYLSFVLKVKEQLNKYIEINDFINKNNIQNYRKNMIVFFDFILLLKKMLSSNLIITNAYLFDKNDIFNYEENSEEWKKMKKVMFRVHSKNDEKIKEEFSNMTKKMEKTTVYVNKAVNQNLLLSASKYTGMYMKFTLNKDKNLITYESKESVLLSDKNIIQEMIKLGRKKIIKVVYAKSYPKIAFREKIYMRRDYPEISLEYIKSLLSKIYGEEIINKNFGNTKQNERITLDEKKKASLPLWSKKVIKDDKKYYVSTRLLNNYQLNFKNNNEKNNIVGKSIIKLFKNKNENITPKALMIYIHGGGFLNTGFFFHENYLRDICKKINIPILGINYVGAPDHPYPEGINDCYQAYMWILEHCEEELGFKPEKIILSGDSSGGNYALCLNFLLLSMNLFEGKKIHTPDFLFPLYPCSNASRKNMSLSLASSFEDSKITIKGLRYINESYRGYYPNELDPFINPRDAPEILIKHMPITRFMTGTHDPLRDDCIRLVYKMCKAEMDVKCYDFYNYQHAFIGCNNPMIKGAPHHIYCQEINEFLRK